MNYKVETGFLLQVTEKALSRFLALRNDNGLSGDYSLRITVVGNKHAGITYRLGFDSKIKESDILIPYPELNIIVDPESQSTLSGTLIDYNDEGASGSFVFNNPNTANKCSCHI